MIFRTIIAFMLLLSLTIQARTQDLDLPENLPPIEVTTSEGVSDGVVYVSTIQRGAPREDEPVYGQYLLVLDNEGKILEFQEVRRNFNFGRMPDGNRYYYNFERDGPGRGASSDGAYRILDRSFNILQEYRIFGEQLPTQAHEFLPLSNGNVLMLSQPLIVRNLTAFGGHERALVSEAVIQEINSDGNVVFAWRSWDHVLFTDTARFEELQISPPEAVSYMHVNALAVDLDGNIILSARRFNELIKINRTNGEIMWRMGGVNSRNNDFTFIDDPYDGFSGQHHVQVLSNGNILLFDNHTNDPTVGSRAVEYAIDEENRTATLVWSYESGRFAPAMGSVQRLDNGNTLIGWGTAPRPNVTEVTMEGNIVYELNLPESQITYRAYRFED
ncbi:MAG: aryl-sulfate sulfotransferase [Chloroflexota bacterium]